jgi:DNA-directed RNA polymerase II subunit RPB4
MARIARVEEDVSGQYEQLGEDFTSGGERKVQAMANAEVALVLAEKRQRDPAKDYNKNKAFLASEDYTNRVAQFRDKDAVTEVRAVLEKKEFTEVSRPRTRRARPPASSPPPAASRRRRSAQFEMAQLANLCPQDIQEAKTLIPTLENMSDRNLDDSQLSEVLDQLQQLQSYGN